ncbi:hypothetical protein D3C80_1737520 [compost metagenome]
MCNTHGGEARRTQQHAGDNHRFCTEAVSNRPTKNAKPLLYKLPQTQRNADH